MTLKRVSLMIEGGVHSGSKRVSLMVPIYMRVITRLRHDSGKSPRKRADAFTASRFEGCSVKCRRNRCVSD
jgi:hypothetical protein